MQFRFIKRGRRQTVPAADVLAAPPAGRVALQTALALVRCRRSGRRHAGVRIAGFKNRPYRRSCPDFAQEADLNATAIWGKTKDA